MNYQVCWKYPEESKYDPWHAMFFYLKENAIEDYKMHKSLGQETKILTIGAK